MGRIGPWLAIGVVLPALAHADNGVRLRPTDAVIATRDVGTDSGARVAARTEDVRLAERWREVPAGQHLKLSDQITDQLTELGNFIGENVNVLSDDMLALKFDGRRRYARIRFGADAGGLLRFNLDTGWHFAQGKARIQTRVDLGIGNHQFHLDLPDMEMAPTEYHGERGVEVRLPLIERRW